MSEKAIITRISGPIVESSGMQNALMYELVEVGEARLVGEVIRVTGDRATIQVYENTSMVAPGAPVFRTMSPFSLLLGPGLIGNIYDGIQRPLPGIARKSGAFVKRGEKVPPLDIEKKWHFVPSALIGDNVAAGQIIGSVQETSIIANRVMLPPGVAGKLDFIAAEGDYTLDETVARVKTAHGIESIKLVQRWPARKPRPFIRREPVDTPLVTGQRVIDSFFPVGMGGTAAIPGGFGTGKTMMQHALAKWSNADIIVYVGCGERGNEMTSVLREFPELEDPRTGKSLMERTVLIANTSNMPVAAREVSIYTGITIAEYYRDMGYHVALMADSTSRWAEALRELSGRLEELPAEEGFPAYLATRLAQFYERAGRVRTLSGRDASVSVVGAVSPPGGDFSEPVTQHTRRFIRCFWALDKELANARHYPAINWLTSYSEYVPFIQNWWEKIDPDWPAMRARAMEILQRESRLQQIVKLVGPDVLPDSQRLVLFVAEIFKNGFLQQSAFDENDRYTSPQKQASLLRILVMINDRGTQIIAKGAAWTQVSGMRCIGDVVRAKSAIRNDDLDAMKRLERLVMAELDELERSKG
ncbi:MAG TPA: V-type ATP synthase subunit A [Planctomycetota bacterium]|nr:V-type ATP synthase subunit A [Planctomycetota bacterium]